MLSDDGLDLLFRNARTHKVWLDRPVPEDLLRRVYDLARLGPTSANCSPMRVLFLTSREAKERLRPALSPTNVDKTMHGQEGSTYSEESATIDSTLNALSAACAADSAPAADAKGEETPAAP